MDTAHIQAILILAAGASSRMRGGDKLLELAPDIPQLRRICQAALSTGLPVFAAVNQSYPARAEVLQGLDITLVAVPDAKNGMSASIRAGITALPAHISQLMILPADMPELTSSDLSLVLRAASTAESDVIYRGATENGKQGHPVVFPKAVFPDLRDLTGDRGAQKIIQSKQLPIRLITLPGNHAVVDLDTPEDWAAWRAGLFVPQ